MSASLSRRLIQVNVALLTAMIVMGAALTWGIFSLRTALTSASDEYEELQIVEQTVFYVNMARSATLQDPPDYDAAAERIELSMKRLDMFREFQSAEHAADEDHQDSEAESLEDVERELNELLSNIRENHAATQEQFDRVVVDLSRLASDTDVIEARRSAAGRSVTILIAVCSLCGLLVLGSIAAIGILYWSVVAPIKRVHAGVQRIASGTFGERLDEHGSREIEELSREFNQMAAELESLYTDLENKVREQSRELVRSERLASVGFLAAGVAHEINNPLNIMSGYAEMAQRWMKDLTPARKQEVLDALEMIRSEAFRCKEITKQLLSLAATGSTQRSKVDIPHLVEEVAQMLTGIPKYRDHAVAVRSEPNADSPVLAVPQEIKQVLLNLMVNAMESLPAGRGRIDVSTLRKNDHIEVTVRDNGCGMTPDALEHAFEPFFTSKPKNGTSGVGLGLSISHAIVRNHGGRIRAESEGPGKGSRFIVEFPVEREEKVNADGP